MDHKKILDFIISELVDLFDLADDDPLHVALHVRNAIINLHCDLEVERELNRQLKVRINKLEGKDNET